MITRVTLHSLDDGQVVVEKQLLAEAQDTESDHPANAIKQALTDDLRAEAEWLAVARHSGVVQLVGVREHPFTVRTAHAGTTTLRTAQPHPQTAARLLAATAKTLADLHARELVHGNLTLDHVIVSGENRTTLCSPHGLIDDPTVDTRALGQMLTELLERWQEDGSAPSSESEWSSLADRLRSPESNLTATRAHLAFGRLTPKPEGASSERPTGSVGSFLANRTSSPTVVGLAVTAVVVIALLTAWLTLMRSPAPEAAQPSAVEIVVDLDLFSVGIGDDIAVAVPARCQNQPAVVLLDTNSVVWVFDQAADQESGRALAQIPGARDLVAEVSGGCGRVWATGPAGQTLVVGSD